MPRWPLRSWAPTALLYSFAGLIGIGGGRWMQRVEIANRVLGTSPAGGKLPAAVHAAGRSVAAFGGGAGPCGWPKAPTPPRFDFNWVKREGARFGHQALMQMAAAASSEVARDATVTLVGPRRR